MDARSLRKNRLCQLVDLVRDYRGVSRRELGRLLGRSPERLIPESGHLKHKDVVKLAELLDWPLERVSSFIMASGNGKPVPVECGKYEELQTASREAWLKGQHVRAAILAERAYAAAETPDQRALACIRGSAAHDGLGHYEVALTTAQTGLQQSPISSELRLNLEALLANAYYTLGRLAEARSLAKDVTDRFRGRRPENEREHSAVAFAHYVRGNALREMITTEPERAREHARMATRGLCAARRLYLRMAAEYGNDSYAGIANTCAGGLVETEVELGLRDPESALEELIAGLEVVVDPSECPTGDWLESYGWWCVFGGNIALKHLSDDEPKLQRYLAVFTMKADEIANRNDNWALRARVFAMEYISSERIVKLTGRRPFLMQDKDDRRAVIGTMGRFPMFFDICLRLLQWAVVVRE